MNVIEFTALVWIGSFVAGLLGALTGLGGGVVLVPLLTLFFHVDLRYAIGASLVSVIATSSGAAAAYVKEGFSNIRIGMFLEIATTIGALLGAYLTVMVPTNAIAVIFGVVLVYSAYLSRRPRPKHVNAIFRRIRLATRLQMNGSFPDAEEKDGIRSYNVQHVPAGFSLMFGAGALSGLLGIGSGAVKVLAMDQAMKIPFKVSTTTSNFMIGVTAAASAGVYLSRGFIDPGLAMPVMLGVLAGSLLGSRILIQTETKVLRGSFSAWSSRCSAWKCFTRDLPGGFEMAVAKPRADKPWTDKKIEDIVGNLLRVGVLVSAFVVLLGGAIYLARHGRSPANYRVFQGEPADFRRIGGILKQAFALSGRGIIQLGLLLLIATPVARVAFAVVGIRRGRRPDVCDFHRDCAGHPALQPGRVGDDVLVLVILSGGG